MTYQPSKEEMKSLMAMLEVSASKIKRKYRFADFDDLISAGNYALALSLRRYDPEKGASSWTFCEKAVRGAMIRSIEKESRLSALKSETSDNCIPEVAFEPGSGEEEVIMKKEFFELSDSEQEILSMWSQGATYEEIAAHIGLNKSSAWRRVDDILSRMRNKIGLRCDI